MLRRHPADTVTGPACLPSQDPVPQYVWHPYPDPAQPYEKRLLHAVSPEQMHTLTLAKARPTRAALPGPMVPAPVKHATQHVHLANVTDAAEQPMTVPGPPARAVSTVAFQEDVSEGMIRGSLPIMTAWTRRTPHGISLTALSYRRRACFQEERFHATDKWQSAAPACSSCGMIVNTTQNNQSAAQERSYR